MINIISGAGLFLFYNDGNENKYLILLNSQTNIWEPPKGIKDLSESSLTCALRECEEETSINIDLNINTIFFPFAINYKLSNNDQKYIKIFPTKLTTQKLVLLSYEHKAFKWINWDDAKKLNNSNTLKDCYFEIIDNVESYNKSVLIEFRNKISKSLKDVIVNDSQTSNFDWVLTGSISANEVTFYKDKILSDIDLVAIGDKIPEHNEINQINDIFKSRLCQKNYFHRLSIGAMYIDRTEVIDTSTPFGSYLEQYYSLINSSSVQLHFYKKGSDDNCYNIFRLFWYTCLRCHFLDEIECNYLYLKANLFLFYLNNRNKFSYFSYSEIKKKILIELSKSVCENTEKSLLTLLQAADTKLNHSNFLMKLNWRKLFFNEFEISKEKLNNAECLILTEIFKILNSKFEVSSDLIKLFHFYLDNKDINYLYSNACRIKDGNIIWVLLILLRIKIWPSQVKFSIEKYADNIRKLLRYNVLIKNEIIKNKLSSILIKNGFDILKSKVSQNN